MMEITYLIQGISLIASFGVIAMTYHVYRLNHRHTQIDSYLLHIVNLYYKIEEDSKILRTIKVTADEDTLIQCYRRLETNATLMRYYVRKFPNHYKGKKIFEQVIDSISHSPEIIEDYDKLNDEFKKFCKNIENRK